MNSIELPQNYEVKAERYRRSYYAFFKDAFNVLEPQTKFVDNWHIQYLCDRLQQEVERIARGDKKKKDLIINIPPRTLKSKIVTVCLHAWAWISYPSPSI